jgi:hypothetical protein
VFEVRAEESLRMTRLSAESERSSARSVQI